jgi:sigma-B regulation protein RsbU (phosphoserine phosphatase)
MTPHPNDPPDIPIPMLKRLHVPNIAANFVGVLVCIIYFAVFVFPDEKSIFWVLAVPSLLALLLTCTGIFLQTRWTHGIGWIFHKLPQGCAVPAHILTRARREILNLPMVSAITSLGIWSVGAFAMAAIRWLRYHPDSGYPAAFLLSFRVWFGILLSGIVSSAIVLFSTEILCRKIRPYFFPDGNLMHTPGAIRINLQHKALITFSLAGILPLVLVGVLLYYRISMPRDQSPEAIIPVLLHTVAFICGAGIAAVVTLSRLFVVSLTDPIRDIEEGMRRVESGDLEHPVPVYSCDEFGGMMENFNKMVGALQERERLKQALNTAMEVQQNLLPRRLPQPDGWEIAAWAVYCDETGGDYYDVILPSSLSDTRPVLIVGDVSDHGIPAALLMASARALIRMRASMSDDPLHRILQDVNQALCRDMEDSGRFMTLFCCRIDKGNNRLTWVNAGHDPAVLIDPASGEWQELRSRHLPLGIFEESEYRETSTPIFPGQSLVIATDGVWEAENEAGERFGKQRLYTLLGSHATESAPQMVAAVMRSVDRFSAPNRRKDDITIMVVKRT